MFRSPRALFSWSPRPDQDVEASPATQSSSRFGALHNNIRTMINGSSVYSQSPALSNFNTPKPAFAAFWNRQQPSDSNDLPISNDAPRGLNDSAEPLHAQHTAGSYIRTITPPQDPQEPTTVYARHPADVPLPNQQAGSVDPEIQQLADEINGRRHRRRKHRRRRHHRGERSEHSSRSNYSNHSNQWVRRRDEHRLAVIYVRGSAARGKMIACVLSGSILITILSLYLAIALTDRNLGQEIHILFIMVLLSITIFFCHSLIRLCMLILHPPRDDNNNNNNATHPPLPDMNAVEGFQPIVPIRVHLARDEEAAAVSDDVLVNDAGHGDIDDVEKFMPPPPPPAYGLWRSSVRVDPNLLHWQRADSSSAAASPMHSRNGSIAGLPLGSSQLPASDASAPLAEQVGPRPPSYVSEDGVSYAIEAAPRCTVRDSGAGFSDVHPAYRPGYAMSDIRPDELPAARRI